MKPIEKFFTSKPLRKTRTLILPLILLILVLILTSTTQQSALAQLVHKQYIPLVLTPAEANLPLGWHALGLPAEAACMDIDTAYDSSMRLYASTREGIYRSNDRGSTWDLIASGFIRKLVSDPQAPQTLYAGPDLGQQSGIFKSTDGGDTWTGYNEGMTCTNLAGLSISVSHPNILFTGSF